MSLEVSGVLGDVAPVILDWGMNSGMSRGGGGGALFVREWNDGWVKVDKRGFLCWQSFQELILNAVKGK